MFYVLNKNRDSFITAEHYSCFFVGSDCGIKATETNGGKVIRLGEYRGMEVAQAVMADLLTHAATGGVYRMPDDERAQTLVRTAAPAAPDKFAANGKKPTRRGGS